MQKRQTVEIFQSRLSKLMERTGQTQARFAAKAGIDRSTLSQLLSENNVRLPRAETIAHIAMRHSVSVDWLLGLSQHDQAVPDVVSQPTVEPDADDPYNESLRRWHEEVRGGKIRYVPSSLPDQVKTEEVIRYENVKLTTPTATFMADSARARIEHARRGESEIEVCTSRQSLELFSRGEGIWRKLHIAERRRQLEHMAAIAEDLYPAYRWFLFDARQCYAAPYTVFGQKRAVTYLGSMYFVYTSTEHIRALSQHFDTLIRQAVIQPNEAATFVRKLLKDIA